MSNFSQFNLVQNVFTLNMFSNFASSKKADQATLQADLTTIVDNLLGNEFLQQTMGTWNVVWGPVVGSYGTDAKREDIDTLLQKIEKHLSTFPDQAAINEVITVVVAILAQLENVMLYLTQLAFQHVTSYAFLMGTSSIHELTQGIINNLVLNGGLSPEYTNLVDNLNNPVLLVTQMAGAVGNLIEGAIKNDVTLVKKILDKHALGMI